MRHRSDRRGFTLIELLVVILVVFLLIGLLLVGFRFARNSARKTADRSTVATLKQNIAFFQEQIGFLPPLVKDLGSPQGSGPNYTFNNDPPVMLVGGERRIQVYSTGAANELRFLRTSPAPADPDMRFSIYSLPFYLVGAVELERYQSPPSGVSQTTVDGVPGPGMLTPKRDGTFERSGKRFTPFFDTSRSSRALVTIDQTQGKVELRDSNGVAFRYYRWEHGKPSANANGSAGPAGSVVEAADLNIPIILGDASSAELKSAKYALLAAGPNGLFGNEHQLDAAHPQSLTPEQMATKLGIPTPTNQGEIDRMIVMAMEDNVMEIGK